MQAATQANSRNDSSPPRFVVFEGVDGSGKTTLAHALARYDAAIAPTSPLYHGAFPGAEPGTLGEWVYRLHHHRATDAPAPEVIAAPALQLLHVAAHVDAILSRLTPLFAQGGSVILDRYWWSTYAYARYHLPPELAWSLVDAERPFWRGLPAPVVIYLTRERSLKADEIDSAAHAVIDRAYREVIAAERRAGVLVHEIGNDGPLPQTWAALLDALTLPHRPWEEYS